MKMMPVSEEVLKKLYSDWDQIPKGKQRELMGIGPKKEIVNHKNDHFIPSCKTIGFWIGALLAFYSVIYLIIQLV
jgi:hypothetical protein